MGLHIYRTVYSPGSDALFLAALEQIRRCLATDIRSELRHNNRMRAYKISNGETPRPIMDPGPCDQVEAQYEPLVIEDSEVWDGASIEDIRAHFRDAIAQEYLETGNAIYGPEKANTLPWTYDAQDPKSSICLVIDAEALEWMEDTELLKKGWCWNGEMKQLSVHEELRVGLRPFAEGQHGILKGVDADWPRHSDIWGDEGNEASMLGRRNGIPDPPRPVSQYQGCKPVRCDELWDFYNDRFRDGGSLGEIDGFRE